MKKLVFMFAAFAAVSFASCGGNATPAAEVAEAPAATAPECGYRSGSHGLRG